MRPLWRIAGLTGGVLGAVAGGVAIGLAAQRALIARQRRAGEELARLGELPSDRECTVTADDGVPLSVEEIDPVDGGEPELTVVLVHGFTLDRRCWHFQRRDLATLGDPRVRQVLYDQRSHGRSGRAPAESCTIEQLGSDLDAVIRAMAPEGPLVLVGHSLGGMTIMALAELQPDLFAERVQGVALINTCAGEVGRTGLLRPVLSRRNPFPRLAGAIADVQPGAVERIRHLSRDLVWAMTRRYSFGDRGVSPALVDLMDSMIRATPLDVMVDFLPTFSAHDRFAALAGLRHCEVLVIGSDCDRMIPYSHCEAIAADVPDAELVQITGAGHMVMLEHHEVVTGHLEGLLVRCAVRTRAPPWRGA